MKNLLLTGRIALVLAVPVLLLAGCYTDVGTTRGESYPSYSDDQGDHPQYQSQDTQEYYTDTTGNQAESAPYYDDDSYRRDRMYFDYYYPSFAFGAFYSPWYGPAYSPFYYDPFWSGFYYYPYYYTPGFYYPYRGYYSNYPYYGYYNGYYYGTGGAVRGSSVRTFGNMQTGRRTSGVMYNTGATGSTYTAPAAGRGQVTRQQTATPAAKPAPTTGRQVQRAVPRSGSHSGTINRGSAPRSSNRAISRPSSPPSRVYRAPSGSYRGGERMGAGRSYSPPPSRGSSAPSHGGGSRGGGRR